MRKYKKENKHMGKCYIVIEADSNNVGYEYKHHVFARLYRAQEVMAALVRDRLSDDGYGYSEAEIGEIEKRILSNERYYQDTEDEWFIQLVEGELEIDINDL